MLEETNKRHNLEELMKKQELKKILKPLIKECIKEVIFEDGTLSSIISEVVKGVGEPIVETKQSFPKKQQPQYETDEQAKACLLYTSPSPRDKRQSRMPSSA